MKNCNNLKVTVKKMLGKIDEEKTGLVNAEVFFNILELYKIKLKEQVK